jgi:hypothetical protein
MKSRPHNRLRKHQNEPDLEKGNDCKSIDDVAVSRYLPQNALAQIAMLLLPTLPHSPNPELQATQLLSKYLPDVPRSPFATRVNVLSQ